MIQRIFLIVFILLTGYVASMSGLYYFQNDIIFWPVSTEENYCYHFDNPYEEFYLTSSNGNQIDAMYFKTHMKRKGVILYLHGNSKNLGYWAKYSADFLSRGYDFFAIDYQGYGKSEGEPSEDGMYNDARVAYDYLACTTEPGHIIIYGRSLGTGVASNLARERKAALLILETPFYNLEDVFESKSKLFYYPIQLKQSFPNNKHLVEVDIPVHIIHGTNDEIVDYASAKKLTELLKDGDSFTTVEGGGHRNLNQFKAYQRFLDRIL